MPRALLSEGDRLVSISWPGEGGSFFKVGQSSVLSIGVRELPGPMGAYLVANVVFEDGRPDLIAPLHMLDTFQALNP